MCHNLPSSSLTFVRTSTSVNALPPFPLLPSVCVICSGGSGGGGQKGAEVPSTRVLTGGDAHRLDFQKNNLKLIILNSIIADGKNCLQLRIYFCGT